MVRRTHGTRLRVWGYKQGRPSVCRCVGVLVLSVSAFVGVGVFFWDVSGTVGRMGDDVDLRKSSEVFVRTVARMGTCCRG